MNDMNSADVNTSQDSDIDERKFKRDILVFSMVIAILWLALMVMVMTH